MIPEPLKPFAQELLELEKVQSSATGPSPEALERMLQRLEVGLALPAQAVVSVTAPGAAIAPVAGKLGFGLSMLASGILLGSIATALVMRPVVPREAPPVVISQKEIVPIPEPRVEVAPSPPSPPPVVLRPMVRSVPVPVTPQSSLPSEQGFLDIARAAIVSGRSQAALDALDRHSRNFPNGELAEEREALAIQALAQLGDATATRTRAEAFRKSYPNSILLPAVDFAAPP